MKRIYKYWLGGMGSMLLTKLLNLKQQTFDIGAVFGVVVTGVIWGSIAYAIFGKKEIKKQSEAKENTAQKDV